MPRSHPTVRKGMERGSGVGMARLVFWDVDTQWDFMDPSGALYVPGAERLLSTLGCLTRFARERDITVVASVCDHTPSDPEISVRPDYRHTFPPHCLRGTPGQQKIEATALQSPVVLENHGYTRNELTRRFSQDRAEIMIKKQALDVFTNPATATLLDVLQPDQVVVYGVVAELCVDLVVTRLLNAGLRVRWVRDAIAAIDATAAAHCAERWRTLGALPITTAAIVDGNALGA